MNYKVIWEIDVCAESHEAAARKALAIQRDPDATATVFDVTDACDDRKVIDLTELDERRAHDLG